MFLLVSLHWRANGIHRRRSLMSSTLLLQQGSACLFRLICIIFEMSGKWPYRRCFGGGVVSSDKTARSNLVLFLSSFFSIHSVIVEELHSYKCTDTATAWKKFRFTLSVKSDFHKIDTLSIVFHALTRRTMTSLSVDRILMPGYINSSTNFTGYAVGNQLELVYSREAQDHVRQL